MQDGKRKSIFIDGKILMFLQNEGWNRALAVLPCGHRSGEIHSREVTAAVTVVPQGDAGFAGEAGEQRVPQVQAGREEMSDTSRHASPSSL